MTSNNYELIRDIRDIKLFLSNLSARIDVLNTQITTNQIQLGPLKLTADAEFLYVEGPEDKKIKINIATADVSSVSA